MRQTSYRWFSAAGISAVLPNTVSILRPTLTEAIILTISKLSTQRLGGWGAWGQGRSDSQELEVFLEREKALYKGRRELV